MIANAGGGIGFPKRLKDMKRATYLVKLELDKRPFAHSPAFKH